MALHGRPLILQETVLNFGKPTAKRLTFQVVGLDAHTFVQSLGFKELDATGRFDGVLPMIFDENGGRIVGGRLDLRAPGGSLAYVGVVNKADLGTMGNIAFNALRDLRFKSMIIRLDGDLAGEFAARLDIDGAGIGQSTQTQRIIRSLLAKIPLHLNVTTGLFRADRHGQVGRRSAHLDQGCPAASARRRAGNHDRSAPRRGQQQQPRPQSPNR